MNEWPLLHTAIRLTGCINCIFIKGIYTCQSNAMPFFVRCLTLQNRARNLRPPTYAGSPADQAATSLLGILLCERKHFCLASSPPPPFLGLWTFEPGQRGSSQGWLAHPPTCPHSKPCSQATEASLLNREPWGSATAQATTRGMQNNPALVWSRVFKKSLVRTLCTFSHVSNLWRRLHLIISCKQQEKQSGRQRNTHKIFWSITFQPQT